MFTYLEQGWESAKYNSVFEIWSMNSHNVKTEIPGLGKKLLTPPAGLIGLYHISIYKILLHITQHNAKLSSSSVQQSLVERSTSLILIISTPTHPNSNRDSSNDVLPDDPWGWNLVWKHYSTKLGQLAN